MHNNCIKIKPADDIDHTLKITFIKLCKFISFSADEFQRLSCFALASVFVII